MFLIKLKGLCQELRVSQVLCCEFETLNPKKGGGVELKSTPDLENFVFLCSRSQNMKSKWLKWKVVNIEFQKIRKCQQMLIQNELPFIFQSQQMLVSTFYGLIVKKCRFFPFYFFKYQNSGQSFYFPRKWWKMDIYLSQNFGGLWWSSQD